MDQVLSVDEKGRLVIPKKIREAAGLEAPGQLLLVMLRRGRIELVRVDPEMKSAKEIAKMKFKGWREEDHEAERLASRLAGGPPV